MKKSILLTAVVCFILLGAKAQLANTKWQGSIKIPMQDGVMTPFASTWEFKPDTLTVTYAMNKLPTDVMSYTDEKGVISIRKVSGSVPCDNDAVGKFSYEIRNNQLFIHKIEDACEARGHADVSAPFDRVQ